MSNVLSTPLRRGCFLGVVILLILVAAIVPGFWLYTVVAIYMALTVGVLFGIGLSFVLIYLLICVFNWVSSGEWEWDI